jgi:branched-chain amino acid transport system ATP-binding protein
MSSTILDVRNLGKQFSGFYAVDDVSLQVNRGALHALIGPNGAGKTTLFNLLTKFLQPSQGSIFYDGQDITNTKPSRVARMGIVRSFQISAVFPQMSVRDNIRVALQRKVGNSFHFWESDRILDELNERAMELLVSVGLESASEAIAINLPYGQRRILEIATTLALEPDLLLLDEPMAGLGREDIGVVSALIREANRYRSILMVEHNLSVVAELSSKITVMARGCVLAEGSYEEISSNPEVRAAYIGSAHD